MLTAEDLKLLILFGIMLIMAVVLILIINIYMQKRFIDAMKNQYTQDNIVIKEHYDQSNKRLVEDVLKITKLTKAIDEKIKIEDEEPEKDLFKTFTNLRNSIKDNFTQTMTTIKADRIAIYLFHNGNESTHGIKFFKMSCICEKVAIGSGVKEQSIDQSNIPINLFDDMISQLIDHGKYIIIRDDNLINSNHRIFISAKKIKYSQAVAIFDKSNNILGFVLAEMDQEYDKNRASKELISIKELIDKIVPILSYANYTEEATKKNK